MDADARFVIGVEELYIFVAETPALTRGSLLR